MPELVHNRGRFPPVVLEPSRNHEKHRISHPPVSANVVCRQNPAQVRRTGQYSRSPIARTTAAKPPVRLAVITHAAEAQKVYLLLLGVQRFYQRKPCERKVAVVVETRLPVVPLLLVVRIIHPVPEQRHVQLSLWVAAVIPHDASVGIQNRRASCGE